MFGWCVPRAAALLRVSRTTVDCTPLICPSYAGEEEEKKLLETLGRVKARALKEHRVSDVDISSWL